MVTIDTTLTDYHGNPINEDYAVFYIGCILLIIITILFIMISINKIRMKIYEYKISRPTKEQIKRKEEWKRKLNQKNKIDPEMFSNEPLDYEKAKNMKYRAYTQAQWNELKK